jgi:broad specificity phosphatase PhoE
VSIAQLKSPPQNQDNELSMSTKSVTRFYLARHGETEWNRERRLQGRLDSPLTQAGQLQAQQLGNRLLDKKIDLIIASPLGRASRTAMLCQKILQVDWRADEALQERHFGDWQQRIFDDLSDCPDFHSVFFKVTDIAPPNGETGTACGRRVEQALRRIASDYDSHNILIVTHGDAIRCFLAILEYGSECDAYSQSGNGHDYAVGFCHQSQSFKLLE